MGREEEEERNERMQQLHNTARCPLAARLPLCTTPRGREEAAGVQLGYLRLKQATPWRAVEIRAVSVEWLPI